MNNAIGLPDEALTAEAVRPSLSAVANFLIDFHEEGGTTSIYVMSPLRIEMLAYFAHGHHLAIHGRPLCEEAPKIRAWGPVFPTLYLAMRRKGMPAGALPLEDHPATRAFLVHIEKRYAAYTCDGLSQIASRPGSAWRRALTERQRLGLPFKDATIPDEQLTRYFSHEVL